MQIHRLRRGTLALAAVAAAAAITMAACDDDILSPEDRAAVIRSLVQLGPVGGDRVLRAGHDTRVAALVTDAAGQPVEGADLVWSTSQGSGSVTADGSETDADGLLAGTWTLGTLAGLQEVVVAVDGTDLVDRTDVVVFPDTVVGSLTVTARNSIVRGDTTRVLVTDARDRFGNPYVLVGASAANPPPIEFTSLNPSILVLVSTTSRSALVSGVAAGVARIVARSDGKADTVAIQVTP